MTNLSHVVQDERTARMLLSMTVEPDDAVTGRLLGELGAFELLRLAERDDAVPGLSAVDAQVWRAQFERSDARTLGQRIVDAERAGIGTLIPGDGSGHPHSTILATGGHTSCGLVARHLTSRDHSMISSRSPGRGPRLHTASMSPRNWPPISPTRSG